MATVVVINDQEQVTVSYMTIDGNALPDGTLLSVSVQDESVCSALPDAGGALSLVIAAEDEVAADDVAQTAIDVTVTMSDGATLTDIIAVNVTSTEAPQLIGSSGLPEPLEADEEEVDDEEVDDEDEAVDEADEEEDAAETADVPVEEPKA